MKLKDVIAGVLLIGMLIVLTGCPSGCPSGPDSGSGQDTIAQDSTVIDSTSLKKIED